MIPPGNTEFDDFLGRLFYIAMPFQWTPDVKGFSREKLIPNYGHNDKHGTKNEVFR